LDGWGAYRGAQLNDGASILPVQAAFNQVVFGVHLLAGERKLAENVLARELLRLVFALWSLDALANRLDEFSL
jgi:hypothetical protein